MSKKQFYSHLIEVDTLIIELEKMDLDDNEKITLAALVDSNLHHSILDMLLSELNEEDKKTLIDNLQKQDHEKTWELLNSKIEKVEDKIKNTADEIKKDLHKDIKEAHAIRHKHLKGEL